MLDIAVPQDTGFPVQSSGFEVCQCPEGYGGASCELCQAGFYRDIFNKTQCPMGNCLPCNCPDGRGCVMNASTRAVECLEEEKSPIGKSSPLKSRNFATVTSAIRPAS